MKLQRYIDLTATAALVIVTACVLAAVFASDAHAQADVQFELDLSSQRAPVATWSAEGATSCVASGLWSGDKGATGTETLDPLTDSGGYTLECAFAGDSLAELTWTNPTQNTDGTPYDNPQDTVLIWSQGSLEGMTCEDVGEVESTTRPGDQVMHTVTGLDAGTWNFGAFARNDMGLCSAMSVSASKMITGEVTVSDTISVKVPGVIDAFTVQ